MGWVLLFYECTDRMFVDQMSLAAGFDFDDILIKFFDFALHLITILQYYRHFFVRVFNTIQKLILQI